MGWVDPWVGLGQAGSRFFSFWWVGLGPLQQKYYKFERIILMHLKHGWITFGCTSQLNFILWPIWQVPKTDQKE